MVAFEKVLDEVQRRAGDAGEALQSLRLGAVTPDLPRLGTESLATAHAVAAYQSMQGETWTAPPQARQETAPIPDLMAEACRSPNKLKKLRRQLAWRLHPDREPMRDSRPLAEVNAAIDAALAGCRAK
jgi:hypothetical protein